MSQIITSARPRVRVNYKFAILGPALLSPLSPEFWEQGRQGAAAGVGRRVASGGYKTSSSGPLGYSDTEVSVDGRCSLLPLLDRTPDARPVQRKRPPLPLSIMQLSSSTSLPDSPRHSQRGPDPKLRSQSLPGSRHASRPTTPRRHPLDFQVRHSFSSFSSLMRSSG